jgi:hypothetical protein
VYFRLTNTEQAAAAAQGLSKPQGLGYGIGLGFALFIMQGENGRTLSFLIHFLIPNAEASSLVSGALHLPFIIIQRRFHEKMTNHYTQSKFFCISANNSKY